MLYPTYNVCDCTRGFLYQGFDIDAIPDKYRETFKGMQALGQTVHIDGTLVFLIK